MNTKLPPNMRNHKPKHKVSMKNNRAIRSLTVMWLQQDTDTNKEKA